LFSIITKLLFSGVGKSTLGNQLIGDKKSFAVGHKFLSKTEQISYVTDQYLGVGKCITIIDTPGTKDTGGRPILIFVKLSKSR
jgi:GTPase Era involved in 16S rRNA processing